MGRLPDVLAMVDPLQAALGAVLGACAAGTLGWLASRLRARGTATAYTRKLFHLGIFTIAAFTHYVAGPVAVLAYGSVVSLAVLYAVWRGAGYGLYEALARPSDAPHRTLFVVVPLVTTAVGGVTSAWLFGPFAAVGYLVAGWGDAVAEPVGTRWGRHRYRVPSLMGVAATRSIEGSAAVLFAGTVAAWLALGLAGFAMRAALLPGVAAGLAAALVEAASTHGLDNFTVQIAASGMAWLLLN